MEKFKTITITSNSILKSIVSDCLVSGTRNPKKGPESHTSMPYKGLWDTGATNTVISPKVVDQLKLKQRGRATVKHGGGTQEKVPTYLIIIMLENGVIFSGVEAAVLPITEADILIGMDIIGQGDFFLTNIGGKTHFSFKTLS